MANVAPAIRDQLNAVLVNKSAQYWDTLNTFLCGKISRVEFEELVREVIDTPNLGMSIINTINISSLIPIGLNSSTSQFADNFCSGVMLASCSPDPAT